LIKWLAVYAAVVLFLAWLGEHWVGSTVFLFVCVWLPWPLLAAYGQAQRGGNVFHGLLAGLLFGPLGLLVANYSGGKKKESSTRERG
jgi:hypothetical protein